MNKKFRKTCDMLPYFERNQALCSNIVNTSLKTDLYFLFFSSGFCQSVPNITWGKHIRVVLDVGCGVASFGGYLFDRDVLTMSFAPKDEHEAQVQFALERGIPAISAVMGSQRLPFPSRVFDLIHCARCRVPWHEEGNSLLVAPFEKALYCFL